MGQAMGGYYGAAYGPLGASMAAAAAAAAQQNAISAALTPNPQVRLYFWTIKKIHTDRIENHLRLEIGVQFVGFLRLHIFILCVNNFGTGLHLGT